MKQNSKHIEKWMCLCFLEGDMVLIYPEVNRMGCRAQCCEQGLQLVVCGRVSQEQLWVVGAVRTSMPGNDILWVLIPWIRSLSTPKHEEIADG